MFCGLFGLTIACAIAEAPLNALLALLFRAILGTPPVFTASTLRVRAVLVCMVLFGGAFVVGGAFVWQAGARVEKALETTLDAGTNSLDAAVVLVSSLLGRILPLAASLNAALVTLGQPAYDISPLLAPIATFNSTSERVQRLLDDYHPRITRGLQGIVKGTLALGATVAGATLLLWGVSGRKYRRSLAGTGVLIWVLAILLWLLAGIAYILYLFASDGCATLNWVVDSPSTAGLSSLIPCLNTSFAPATYSLALQPTYVGVASLNAALHACRYDPVQGTLAAPLGAGLLCNPVRSVASAYALASPSSCASNSTALGTAAFLAAYAGSQTWSLSYVPDSASAASNFTRIYNGSYTSLGNGTGYGNFSYTSVACPLISAAPATMQLLAQTSQSCGDMLLVAASAAPLLSCSFVYTVLNTAQAQCVPLEKALSLLTRGCIIAGVAACVLLLLAGLLYRHLHPERVRLTQEKVLSEKEEADTRGFARHPSVAMRALAAADVEQPGGQGGAFIVGGSSKEEQVRALEARLALARVQALEMELERARSRAAPRSQPMPQPMPQPPRRYDQEPPSAPPLPPRGRW